MKDGQTHLAHKHEHAVDMESGAIVAVTHSNRRRTNGRWVDDAMEFFGDDFGRAIIAHAFADVSSAQPILAARAVVASVSGWLAMNAAWMLAELSNPPSRW